MSVSPCHVVLLTPPGRGAVATVLVAGRGATAIVDRHFCAAANKPLGDFPIGRIVFGCWKGTAPLTPYSEAVREPSPLGRRQGVGNLLQLRIASNSPHPNPLPKGKGEITDSLSVLSTEHPHSLGEELVVCRITDAEVEIHCHGGSAAAGAIIAALVADGCTPCDWQSWRLATAVAPIAAAAEIALADATTTRTAAILLDQFHGALRREILAIIAACEASDHERAVARLAALAARGQLGLHLTSPWRIVLAGHPNVGKSSLLNALLGYTRAIVFDEPGTTRDVVTATTAIDGWPVELSDTAGLRNASDSTEADGVARARRAAATADMLVLVFDATQPWSPDDQSLVEAYPHAIIVINKCDLRGVGLPTCPHVRTSALTSEGVATLIRAIGERLVPADPCAGNAMPFLLPHIEAITRALALAQVDDLPAAALELQRLLLKSP